MRHLMAATLCAFAAQAAAEDLPVVVELYTSQGCSSCPPADALLHELAGMKNVIPLALHVDYWDYIGWPDGFAKAAHTERQEAYARSIGERMIYTPQMIFNGTDRVIGGDTMAVMDQLQAHAGATTPVELHVSRDGDRVSIAARSDVALPPMTVQLVRYSPLETVSIESGENEGQTLDYTNIVTDWQVVGEWTGQEPLALDVDAPAGEPLVVILQEHGPGRIRAARRLD